MCYILAGVDCLHVFVLIQQVFDSITGNSFVENPCAPLKDPGTEVDRFVHSVDQDHVLGIYSSSEVGVESVTERSCLALARKIEKGHFTLEDLHDEVLQFRT